MNITNLEIIQASMEAIGALFCLITLFFLAINKMTKKTKYLMMMFGFSTAMFLLDACAYIFRGNTDELSVFMTRFSNIGIFIFNVGIIITFVGYFYNIVGMNGIHLSGIYARLAILFYLLAGLCIVINFFNNWMFYFDEKNYYHRNFGWYVYTGFLVLGILVIVYATLSIRKQISKSLFIVLLLYEAAPFIPVIVQIFLYGITVANIGVTSSLTLLLLFYIKQQAKEKKKQGISDAKENNMFITIIMLALMVVCMSFSIISCVANIQNIAAENSEKETRNIAHLVRADIENNFLPYLTTAKIITSDNSVCKILENTTLERAKESESFLSNYLNNIKEEFGYQMVFIASDKSGAYYTYDGISKYIDVEKDAHDIWYKNFKSSNKKYLLNIDTDESNNGELTVFINREIVDDKGKLIGVGGVGIDIKKLQAMLELYEKEYNLEINLISRDGLVQVNSDSRVIEKKYIDNLNLDCIPEGEFVYERKIEFSRMTYYLDLLDWYLVIDDYHPDKISAQRIVLPCLTIFMVGLIVMGVTFTFISKKERENSEKLIETTKISLTDELTGLYNRRAYDEYVEKIDEEQLHDNVVFIMMDVNGLKTVNDGIGHDAGDELLLGSAECMNSAFADLGRIFRLGGDEFMAILECSASEAHLAVDALDAVTKKWKGKVINDISISKGLVIGNEHPEMTISEIEDLADKLMYEDKDAYYKRTGKKRRV